MSGIPSDIAGSALQAGYQARNAAKAREAERAGQANNAREATKGAEEAASVVETDDNDTQIYADAEGTGSKGRVFEEELVEEETPDQEQQGADGVTTDDDGTMHLDVEA